VSSKTLTRSYKTHLSNFQTWNQLSHANSYILFPENLGTHLSIDETCLKGELYTILTNKAAKGKKGALVAMIKGTSNQVVSEVLSKMPYEKRLLVEEVTADMANTMEWIIRCNFPQAVKIVDRFHVQKLISEAVQVVRIEQRNIALEEENVAILEHRKQGEKYYAPRYENGDTKKQLLARSRHLLFKPKSRWSASQVKRATILFREFPEIKKAYELSMMFRNFYEAKTVTAAVKRLQQWYEKVKKYKDVLPGFILAAQSVKVHQSDILRYFADRSTNAAAESFNAKIKGFRSLLRGVRDMEFFLFRLSKLYA